MAAPTSKQALLRNINATNADSELAELTEDDLDFSLPTVINQGPYNTAITLTARPSDSLFGSRTFQYTRLALGQYLTVNGAVTLGLDAKVKDLLPAINAANRTGLQVEDLENPDEALPALSPVPTIVTIKAGTNSVAWMGEMNVQVMAEKVSIDTLLPNSDLPGLVYRVSIDRLLANNDLPGLKYQLPIEKLLPNHDLPGLEYSVGIDQLLPVHDLPGLDYAVDVDRLLPNHDLPGLTYGSDEIPS